MRKLIFAFLLAGIVIAPSARAQVGVSVNIGVQPVWGPIGYDRVDYYYLPDVDAYYDVPAHVFVYNDGGAWVRRPALPPAFAGYDLYHGYKVVINEPTPWVRHTVYHDRYIVYKGKHDQQFIRDSREPRYYVIKEHPMHGQSHPDNHPVNHVEKHDGGGNNHPVEHKGGGHGGEGHGGGEHKGNGHHR